MKKYFFFGKICSITWCDEFWVKDNLIYKLWYKIKFENFRQKHNWQTKFVTFKNRWIRTKHNTKITQCQREIKNIIFFLKQHRYSHIETFILISINSKFLLLLLTSYSNPWPTSHQGTTLLLHQGSPFYYYYYIIQFYLLKCLTNRFPHGVGTWILHSPSWILHPLLFSENIIVFLMKFSPPSFFIKFN